MRKWLLVAALMAVVATGCGQTNSQAEVPKNPVPREAATSSSTTSGPRGKTPLPGQQAAANTHAKQLP